MRVWSSVTDACTREEKKEYIQGIEESGKKGILEAGNPGAKE